MRITIVQSEIEDAIRDSILRQISVNEGMAIDITLRATRGAEGYQADIEIRPATAVSGERQTSSDQVVEPVSEKTETQPDKPLGIEKTVTTATKVTSRRSRNSTTVAPAVETEATNEVASNDQEAADEPTAPANQQAAGSAEAEPKSEAEAPKVSSIFASKTTTAEPEAETAGETKSIFGGLKRPVNA